MVDWLKITNYRGIANASIAGLAPLTVLVGPNSSGKSSILEALAFVTSPNSGDTIAWLARRRGWVGDATLNALLPEREAEFIVGRGDELTKYSLVHATRDLLSSGTTSVRFQENGFGASSPVPSESRATMIEVERSDLNPARLDEAVSQADLFGNRQTLIDLLRPLLPGIKDLRILQASGRYTLFIVDDSQRPWPTTVAGDGLKKLLLTAAQIASDESGLILVEEPETYLHVGALAQVAKLFWEAVLGSSAKQIVATTHSLEFIDALFAHAAADLSKAALFRLALQKGELKAVRVPGEKVKELRMEIGEDLRK